MCHVNFLTPFIIFFINTSSTNNKNGFFFKPQDSKTLSKKIISILKRKDLNTILDNARLKAIEYDVENTKNEIISIFNNIN